MDDLISRAAIEWHDFLVADGNGMYHEEKVAYKRQIDTLPPVQPEPCDDPRADVYYLAEKIGIHRLYALVVELRGEPEPCEDAVSRGAAIDIFDDYNVSVENGDLEAYSRDRKRLCELPSVQPEQRWIPVTERLPEDEYVLISKKPSKITGSKWSVDIAIRTADPRSGKIQWRDSGFGVIQDDKVLAWQPLPEPYREEGEQG